LPEQLLRLLERIRLLLCWLERRKRRMRLDVDAVETAHLGRDVRLGVHLDRVRVGVLGTPPVLALDNAAPQTDAAEGPAEHVVAIALTEHLQMRLGILASPVRVEAALAVRPRGLVRRLELAAQGARRQPRLPHLRDAARP
jgi:hypothetical protein